MEAIKSENKSTLTVENAPQKAPEISESAGGSRGNLQQSLPHQNESAVSHSGANVGNRERTGSALLGSALIWYGAKKGGIAGSAGCALGAGMLYRGLSGHCSMYEKLGLSTASQADHRHQD